MRRFATFLILAAIVSVTAACNREASESKEPEYKIVLPPTDIPAQQENEQEYTIDLAPLRAAVNANPSDASARFSYMVALRRSGDTMGALDQARILAKMDNNNLFISVAWLNFAQMVLDEVPVDSPGRAELVREAMDGMWISLGYEPASVPGHLALGRLALEAGDKDKALHHLSIALSVTEIGYELRMRMAEIYIEREDYEKARVHLQAARSLAEEAQDREALREIRRLTSRIR